MLTKEEYDFVKSLSGTWNNKAEELSKKRGSKVNTNSLKSDMRRKTIDRRKPTEKIQVNKTYNQDGSVSQVDFNVKMEFLEKKNKTPEDILLYKGYDPKLWSIVTTTSNEWTMNSTEGGIKYNYQLKFTAKPKTDIVDYDALIEGIVAHKEPYDPLNVEIKPEPLYLVMPSFDTHFKGNTLEEYKSSLSKTLTVIKSHSWKKSLLILGGDQLHVDSLDNRTRKGTQLETVDFAKSVDEALSYYEAIIQALIKASKEIEIVSCVGNHDATTGYMLARILERAYSKYDQIHWQVDLRTRKVSMLGQNFIASAHGDKNMKRVIQTLPGEFAEKWARATTRELFVGHLHNELVQSKAFGFIQVRQVSTRIPTDQWHDDNAFVGSAKSFQLVQYNENEVDTVYYV